MLSASSSIAQETYSESTVDLYNKWQLKWFDRWEVCIHIKASTTARFYCLLYVRASSHLIWWLTAGEKRQPPSCLFVLGVPVCYANNPTDHTSQLWHYSLMQNSTHSSLTFKILLIHIVCCNWDTVKLGCSFRNFYLSRKLWLVA